MNIDQIKNIKERIFHDNKKGKESDEPEEFLKWIDIDWDSIRAERRNNKGVK